MKENNLTKDGTEHIVKGLKTFCKKIGLNSGAIYQVINGNYKQHKGWICMRWDQESESLNNVMA